MKTLALFMSLVVVFSAGCVFVGWFALEKCEMKPTIAWIAFATAAPLVIIFGPLMTPVLFGLFIIAVTMEKQHRSQLSVGADISARARRRLGPLDWMGRRVNKRTLATRPRITPGSLEVGYDAGFAPACITFGGDQGHHSLIVGATGAGKTYTTAYVVEQHILAGHGAIVIDPKSDPALREVARHTAGKMDKRFVEWSPDGPSAYNPYKHGSPSEITDKALAAEDYTEPHYLRSAQRHLQHVLYAKRAAGRWPATPQSLVDCFDPATLAELVEAMPVREGQALLDYLDSLSERNRRDLDGTVNRLAILAESEIGAWLGHRSGCDELDLREVVAKREVAYVSLESDRWPMLAEMIAAAMIQDLVTISAELQQSEPIPTVVAIDEFAAISRDRVASLFGRGRSAGLSLVLSTQSIGDLRAGSLDEAFCDQVVDNLSSLIVFRQSTPDNAEYLAGLFGTTDSWSSTQSQANGLTGLVQAGSRRRVKEYVVHPDEIKSLQVGRAFVLDRIRPSHVGECAMYAPFVLDRDRW